MQLENTIETLGKVIWDYTQHIDKELEVLGKRARQELQETSDLAAQCEHTKLIVSELENQLRKLAETPSDHEVLMRDNLRVAKAELNATESALTATLTRLENLKADKKAHDDRRAAQRERISSFTAANAADIAQWEQLLGLKVAVLNTGLRISFGDVHYLITKQSSNYRVAQVNNDGKEIFVEKLEFDGCLPRLFLALRKKTTL